ncbi:hypothetical protein C8R45DRAFT_988989 [Mycena sanguinolenta]|nr:hypothetical protein C8R45DRAFT_988989 [Mycena sanguinolenta]
MVDVAAQMSDRLMLTIFSSALMYWDWLVTLDNEVSFMWKRARSASACWFFAVRYSGVLGNIPVTVFTFYNIPVQWCHAYHIGHQIVLVGTQLIVSLVMLVRIHALYGRNLRVLAALLVTGLPLLAVIFVRIHCSRSSAKADIKSSFSGRNYRLAGAWLALFVFDSLCFGLTLYKTFSTWRRTGSEANHLPIHTLVLRDANLFNIISFYPILSGSLSTFASCVSVTLMARLMLNLHVISNAGRDGSISHVIDLELDDHSTSPVVFRREASMPFARSLEVESERDSFPGFAGYPRGH